MTHPGVREHTYLYDANNRLTNVKNSVGATVMGLDYDVQGNLSNKNGQQYGFDHGNRLRWVMGKESYRYDAYGRRSETLKDDGSAHVFQYGQSGQYLFSSKVSPASGQTTHEYVYLAGSLIATIDHDWPSNAITATRYQHTDALGSPVATTDTNGALVERTQYEPYGSAINKTVDGIGYTGHVMDAATGLTYMQQRYYDPGIGRFLSVDPVTADGNTGGNFNRYKYAANSPYTFTDPDGRQEAADRFGDQFAKDVKAGNLDVYKPFEGPAIAVTAIMAAPVVVVAGWETGVAVLANPGAVAVATDVAAGAAGVTGTAGLASTLKPGPFAGASIPARSAAQTFTSAERTAINKIGQTTGCHTCGTTNPGTKSGNFVPDHQPVSSLNSANAPQQLLPQCLTCSRQQGLDAIKELRKK